MLPKTKKHYILACEHCTNVIKSGDMQHEEHDRVVRSCNALGDLLSDILDSGAKGAWWGSQVQTALQRTWDMKKCDICTDVTLKQMFTLELFIREK